MKDENVYRKGDNGRYIPYGVCCQPEHMPDGIWYVRHHKYSREYTSLGYMEGLFKVGDAKNLDITELCGMEKLCDYIMESQEFRDVINKDTGYSITDLVHICVKKLVDKTKEQKNENI